mmetsp:Transcript_1113/g.2416  ORF Transcript_1113/g.2416 Transcript_1113/m.2416 type:complete len:262 (+) Transcript_1113:34-819(+)
MDGNMKTPLTTDQDHGHHGQAQGLFLFEQLPGLFIRQKAQWLEEFTGFEQKNRYKMMVKTPGADQAGRDEEVRKLPVSLFAFEESTCCCRQFCGPWREFSMDILDARKEKLLVLERPFKCTILCGCCLINPQELHVKTAGGMLLGTVRQNFKICNFSHWLSVLDAAGNLLYELRIPFCQFGPNCCCTRWETEILQAGTGQIMGSIANVWPGCTVRLCSKADNLEISYDRPMPAEHKAILLGAVFLVDMLHHEQRRGGQEFN